MVSNTETKEVLGTTTPTFEELSLIVPSTGTRIDLAPLLISLVIYEDMFSPVLTVAITIEDKIGLFDKLPIIGNEQLAVKVYTWNYSTEKNNKTDYLHRTFDIIRITDIQKTNDYTKRLTLHFASPELKKNESFKISKGFIDKTTSQIVSEIMTGLYSEENGLNFPLFPFPQNEVNTVSPPLTSNLIENHWSKIDRDDSMELFIEKTKYVEPVVSFPYMKCFDIIDWLAGRSLRYSGEGQAANFLFFENKRGFQFCSIDTLFEARTKSTTEFVYGNAVQNRHVGRDQVRKVFTEKILNLQIQDCYNIIDNLRNGVYASKLYSYNLVNGHVNEYDYNYLTEYYNSESLERNIAKTDYPFIKYNETDLSTRTNANRSFIVHSPSPDTNTITAECTERCNSSKEFSGGDESLQKRLSQLGRLTNYRVLFSISGNSKHKVGDVVTLDLKDLDFNTGNLRIDFKEKSNKYYSGYYLISSIKHTITKFDYSMNIEAIKESYRTKLE